VKASHMLATQSSGLVCVQVKEPFDLAPQLSGMFIGSDRGAEATVRYNISVKSIQNSAPGELWQKIKTSHSKLQLTLCDLTAPEWALYPYIIIIQSSTVGYNPCVSCVLCRPPSTRSTSPPYTFRMSFLCLENLMTQIPRQKEMVAMKMDQKIQEPPDTMDSMYLTLLEGKMLGSTLIASYTVIGRSIPK
jgi:hypothetical protein